MIGFLERIGSVTTVDSALSMLREQADISVSVQKAIDISTELHKDQFRKSGDPYIVHPIAVAAITASFSSDDTMIISALLHDVVEDTHYTEEDVEREFGNDVRHIVHGLTKIVEMRDENLANSDSSKRLTSSALTFRKCL